MQLYHVYQDQYSDAHLGIVTPGCLPPDHAEPITGYGARSPGWNQKVHTLKQATK